MESTIGTGAYKVGAIIMKDTLGNGSGCWVGTCGTLYLVGCGVYAYM